MPPKFKITDLYGAGLILTTCLLPFSIVLAQPLPDGTLPNNSTVNLEGNIYQIDGGTEAGDNLFHSFDDFSVPTGTELLFNNNLAIENIISRVTGNNISNIDGKIATMGNANLFLLNPNGIIFGSQSMLDIGGSFISTTADRIQFPNDMEFRANKTQASPLLMISTPVGLQFGDLVGNIINQSGELFQTSGQTIALVGGDISLEGGTVATFPGGNIELGSVASNSQVKLISLETGWKLDYENVRNFQNVQLIQAKLQEDRESDFPITLASDQIQIQGRKISITEGQQIQVNKNLEINALDTIKIAGSASSDLSPNGIVFSSLLSEAVEDIPGADIVISTSELIIQDGGRISSEVSGTFTNSDQFIIATGNGGDTTINAKESIQLTDENSGIFSSTEGFGSAGKLTINTKDLSVSNGAVITAESTGVAADEEPLATGLGGEIEIIASDNIRLNEAIISSSTSGEGDNAGSLNLETNQLSVFNNSEISVSASGSGLAGNLEIAANSINLNRSSLNAETRVGDQGNITLNNADTLLLRNNSEISTDATELATGGNITLSSEGIALLDNSDINARAVEGRGGNIQITTQGIFQEPDSDIDPTSELGIDGTVTFNTPDVDPASGIFELPDIPIDAAGILAQDLCKFEDEKIAKGSSFIITGRGGLTSTSESSLENRDRIVNWTSREDLEVSNNGTVGLRQRDAQDTTNQASPNIKQSQGLFVADDGSTWLTANAPDTVPQAAKNIHPDCQTQKSATRN